MKLVNCLIECSSSKVLWLPIAVSRAELTIQHLNCLIEQFPNTTRIYFFLCVMPCLKAGLPVASSCCHNFTSMNIIITNVRAVAVSITVWCRDALPEGSAFPFPYKKRKLHRFHDNDDGVCFRFWRSCRRHFRRFLCSRSFAVFPIRVFFSSSLWPAAFVSDRA